MARGLVVGDLRVQELVRAGGRRSFTIVWPEGAVHQAADAFLRTHDGSGTQRTYAYLLGGMIAPGWSGRRWPSERVTLRDLQRYMGLLGAKVPGPHGEPWRVGKRPYGHSALQTAAGCVKGFYVHHASLGVNRELGGQLAVTRLPAAADRRRTLLGHLGRELPDPLAPAPVRRRHPKMLPDGARDALAQVVFTARDRMVITWLCDGGFRVGELCGLHLADLHLREDAACRECHSPHVHVCAPGRQCQPGGGQDQASVGSRGRHGLRRSDQTGQPSDGAHLFRISDGRVSAARSWARDAAGAVGRAPARGAVGARGCARDGEAGR